MKQEVWSQVFTKSYVANDGDNAILAMAELGGDLYIGTGRMGSIQSANIYRLAENGCKKWQKTTPPWSKATGGYTMSMSIFKNQLYVATDQGEVWRTDGMQWYNSTGILPKNSTICTMTHFKNQLFITSGTWIWHTSDGSSWKLAVDLSANDAKNHDICSLAVFKGHLYAGVGRDNANGIQLWRTTNGSNWNKFKEVLPDPLFPMVPGHVHTMKAFGSYLYVGEYHGRGFFRTDGSPGSWEYISDCIKAGDIFRLEEHHGKLYLGASLFWVSGSQDPLLYSSTDGKTWKEEKLVGGPNTSRITSMLSHSGRLFVGTENPKQSCTVVLKELGPKIVSDPYEANNSMAAATKIKLGPTETQISKEINNLTLLENDVDFFNIEYQPGDECWQNAKITPVSPTDTFGLEKYPGYLSVFFQAEYCRPLNIEVYDGKGKLFKKYLTADEIRISCPSEVFEDKKLFVAIRNPNGNAPLRYKLSVTFSNKSGRIIGELLYKFWEDSPYPAPLAYKLFDPTKIYFDIDQLIPKIDTNLSELTEYRNKIEKADWQHRLGQTAFQAALYNEAERFYNSALPTFQELHIDIREAELLRDLGELNSVQGIAFTAEDYFEKAFHLHERLKDTLGCAYDRLLLGKHYLQQKEAFKALLTLEEALELFIGTDDEQGRVMNLLLQAEAFFALEKDEAAVSCLLLVEDHLPILKESVIREIDELKKQMISQMGVKSFEKLYKSLIGEAGHTRLEVLADYSTELI